MKQRVTKAIFPVAGLGTRFLPATKSIPKEIMTLVDRPLIQYAIDEAPRRRHFRVHLRHVAREIRAGGLL
jgi:NDP-sugar pyrophosphorylase family protein